MAIDSAAKRLSAMMVGAIPGYVYPTGAIGVAARQDVVGIYRGLLSVVATVFTSSSTNMVAIMRPLFMMIVGGH